MDEKLLENLYRSNQFETQVLESEIVSGRITEKDKFIAAKQILFGLAVLYVITLAAYLLRPIEGIKLLDICTTIFPPLATLILAAYFHDKSR